MDNRFGYRVMKESYIVEVKMCWKMKIELFCDFGYLIVDLYWRVYLNNREYVEEVSFKIFMDNCSDNEDFCLVVKWIRFVNF